MKKVQLITDGACIGNPGPGGWACILRYNDHKKEMYGSEPHTTNNRMELTAAVKGLSALREGCEVEVVTDSQYMKNGIPKWIAQLEAEGLANGGEEAGVEPGLVGRTGPAERAAQNVWSWTKGHASHADNNRCDELATAAARNQTSSAPLY